MSAEATTEVLTTAQLTEKIYSQEIENLQKVADEAYDILVAKKENKRIPEDVFTHHFLNFFTGKGEVNPGRNVVAEWVGIAGSVTNAVDVYDKDHPEQTLFTVPPIMDTSNIQVSTARGKSLSELHLEHSIVKNSFPGAGSRFVQTTMVDKAKNIAGVHPDMTKSEQQWVAIHERYFGEQKQTQNQSTVEQDTGDLYEFD